MVICYSDRKLMAFRHLTNRHVHSPLPTPRSWHSRSGEGLVLWLRTLRKLGATALGHTCPQTGIVFWLLLHTWETYREQAFTQVATCAPGPPCANKFITHSWNPIPLSPILSLEQQLVSSDLSYSRTIHFISTTTSYPVPSSFLASQPGLSCVLPEESCVSFYVTWEHYQTKVTSHWFPCLRFLGHSGFCSKSGRVLAYGSDSPVRPFPCSVHPIPRSRYILLPFLHGEFMSCLLLNWTCPGFMWGLLLETPCGNLFFLNGMYNRAYFTSDGVLKLNEIWC